MTVDLVARGLALRNGGGGGGGGSGAVAITISSQYLVEDGLNMRPAIQRAITLATTPGESGRVVNDYGNIELEIWEKPFTNPAVFDGTTVLASRTLVVPACDKFEIDFCGARLIMKGPTGGDRYATEGQTVPGIAASGFGFATWNGKWLAGFLVISGVIDDFRMLNVEVDGGFRGNPMTQAVRNLFDKGFLCQDLGDANLGAGNGTGVIRMENVKIHSFSGEIMYDNSSRNHVSLNCSFYNTPQCPWNPNGVGGLFALNLVAGQSYQPAEILGGKGHTYVGGRFYKGGGGGSTFIGGPDPAFGESYSFPVRATDRPAPYTHFIGTRFEDFTGYLYLGCWIRGTIYAVDVPIFLPGFATTGRLRDVDLDIYATADRLGGSVAVQVAAPVTANGLEPKNVQIRLHMSHSEYSGTSGAQWQHGLFLSGIHIAGQCLYSVDGVGAGAYRTDIASYPGRTQPWVFADNFRRISVPQEYLYFASDQVIAPRHAELQLYPTETGVFTLTFDTDHFYTEGQRFEVLHDGSGTGRVVVFLRDGAGMKLSKHLTLRRGTDRLVFRYKNGAWVDEVYTAPEFTQALVDAATITPNLALSDDFELTLGGNRTIANPINGYGGLKGMIIIQQDATGSRVVTWGSNWRFPGGAAVGGVLSTAANAIDVLSFEVRFDGKILAVLSKGFVV